MQPFIETCIEKALNLKTLIDSVTVERDLGYFVSDAFPENTLHFIVGIAKC